MERGGGGFAVLIRVVAETGSTNADLLELARGGAADGLWLRAERQTAGRGRRGRSWESPAGNFYGSTLVRLRAGDPPAAGLGFVAAVALAEVVGDLLAPPLRGRGWGGALPQASNSRRGPTPTPSPEGEGLHVLLKWPNDLLIGGAKVSGILLERADEAVVVGIGVNLAHHPDLSDRPTTSLAAHGVLIDPEAFAEMLAEGFARWLGRWRGEGFAAVRARWLALAHPVGSALAVNLPSGERLDGLFDGLDPDGALLLRPSASLGRALASGERRVIHAADVFLV